jgi:hypothetical protein
MIMKTTLRPLLLLLFAFSSTACVVVSMQSLIDPQSSKFDPQLRGRWVSREKKQEQIYALFDGGPLLESNILAGKGFTDRSELLFEMVVGTLGKHRYLSLKPKSDDSWKGYLLIRYAISGDELQVWLLNSARINEAISQGKLKGESSGGTSDTMISDSPAKFAAYIEANQDPELFEFLGKFKRVGMK